MGNNSFLTGGNGGSPQLVEESIYHLKNASVIFVTAWQREPKDFTRASRASEEAMMQLDHIVNEILRVRDHRRSAGTYANSTLEYQLNINRALWVNPVTRTQQQALVRQGPGNGQLPSAGTPLAMEKLLNKIKHRRPGDANFRISALGEHVFLVAADTPKHHPDSIVEFIVGEFCNHCSEIASLLRNEPNN